MSLISNFTDSLPKKYRGGSVKDIQELHIKSLFRMLVLGPSYSGKTNLVFYIIKHSPHVFAHLHIIAKNPNQPIYNFLKDKLEDFITFYDQPPNVDIIRKNPLSSNKPELVIVDDFSSDKLLQQKVFSHYFIRGRHFKLSTIMLIHSYFACDKLIRLNSEYVCILRANSKRDLQMIVKDFTITGLTDKLMYKYYEKSTERKGQVLFIDSVKSQLRYNFDRVIQLNDEDKKIDEED